MDFIVIILIILLIIAIAYIIYSKRLVKFDDNLSFLDPDYENKRMEEIKYDLMV